MAKFLKVKCKGYWQPFGDVPEPNQYGNIGIDTQGLGSCTSGDYLINLDYVSSIDLTDGRQLSLAMNNVQSIHSNSVGEFGENNPATTIKFIWGKPDDQGQQGIYDQPANLIGGEEDWDIYKSELDEFGESFDFPKNAWEAHKQLQKLIDSAPGGQCIEWNPTGINGINKNTEPFSDIELGLLGFVFVQNFEP